MDTSIVKVNTFTAQPQGKYFRKELPVSNSGQPVWANVEIEVTLPGAGVGGGDIVTTRNGHRYIAPTPESPDYDEDGNLVSDGRWVYTWDGENRLIAMETTPAAIAIGVPKRKLEFAYDGGSRRIRKQVYEWDSGTSSWTLNSERRFIYDRWNLMAEVDGSGNLIKSHVWGLDLSQTMQGAGGVGGLLWSTDHTGSSSEAHFATYDGNGNVTALINASTASREAHYDYDAFGRTILVEGEAVAESNTYRFSTKYEDAETGLYYYGFRYYSAEFGRWLNRDPIGESGGMNLYGMVGNDPVNRYDVLGMACGTHLTKDEAKALACAINFWLKDAGIFNAVFLWGENDRSMTLKMLKRYMSKSGSELTVPTSVLMGDSGIQAANRDAKTHFGNNGSAPFIRTRIQTSGDLATAVGRTSAKYTLGTEYIPAMPGTMGVLLPGTSIPVIKGELYGERYTFSDTQPGENVNVIFPFLNLEGYLCCWKCGDHVSDHWMADLEKFGHAKSYDVKGFWSFRR